MRTLPELSSSTRHWVFAEKAVSDGGDQGSRSAPSAP
jgi:hypothetical protein